MPDHSIYDTIGIRIPINQRMGSRLRDSRGETHSRSRACARRPLTAIKLHDPLESAAMLVLMACGILGLLGGALRLWL